MIYTHTERIATSYPAWFYFMLYIFDFHHFSKDICLLVEEVQYHISHLKHLHVGKIFWLGDEVKEEAELTQRIGNRGDKISCINGLVAYFLICNIFYRDILLPPPDLQIWKFYVYFWTSLCVAVRKMWYKLNQWCNV